MAGLVNLLKRKRRQKLEVILEDGDEFLSTSLINGSYFCNIPSLQPSEGTNNLLDAEISSEVREQVLGEHLGRDVQLALVHEAGREQEREMFVEPGVVELVRREEVRMEQGGEMHMEAEVVLVERREKGQEDSEETEVLLVESRETEQEGSKVTKVTQIVYSFLKLCHLHL